MLVDTIIAPMTGDGERARKVIALYRKRSETDRISFIEWFTMLQAARYDDWLEKTKQTA